MSGKLKRYSLLSIIAIAVAGIASYFIVAHQEYSLGQAYLNSPSYLEGLRRSAEEGDVNAMFRMGNNYKYGYNGLTPDNTEAIKWYQKAIEHGDADAMSALGLMYKKGDGVEIDYEKARLLFEKAADLKNADAFVNLGVMYVNGTGVPKSTEKALSLFVEGANLGSDVAMTNLAQMYQYAEGISHDQEKANHWFEKAAQSGNVKAQHQLGYNLSIGRGAPKIGLELVGCSKKQQIKIIQYLNMLWGRATLMDWAA